MKFDAKCYHDNNHTTLRTDLTSIGYQHDEVYRMVKLQSNRDKWSFYGRHRMQLILLATPAHISAAIRDKHVPIVSFVDSRALYCPEECEINGIFQ